MANRRDEILEVAIGLLREGGIREVTQPKIAARAGMTQSHLTYYFPTRSALLEAVAEQVVDRQLERWDAAGTPETPLALIERIDLITSSAPNSRAMISLILAVNEEPAVRDSMRKLVTGLRQRSQLALEACRPDAVAGAESTALDARLLHAAWVGLAVTGLAMGDADVDGTDTRCRAVERLVQLFVEESPASPPVPLD